jgi:ATP-dependent Zn protease
MSRKLKFLLLKVLILLFAIIILSTEAFLFLGTTFRLNFETTVTRNSITPKFRVTSLVPTLRDRAISLPNIKKVTISQTNLRDGYYYSLNFELEGVNSQPPAIPTNKETYKEAEKLIEEITDALQNNKSVSYELFSSKKFFSGIFKTWSLITVTIIFILLFIFILIKKAENKTTENILSEN